MEHQKTRAEGRTPAQALLKYLSENPRIGKKQLLSGAAVYCGASAAKVPAELRSALEELLAEGRIVRRAMRYEAAAPAEQARSGAPAAKPAEPKAKKKKSTRDSRPAEAAVSEPLTKRQEGERSLAAVRAYLAEHPDATRREILAGAIHHCGLSSEELADPSPQGVATRLRSRMGQVLADLQAAGEVVKKEDAGTYRLKQAPAGSAAGKKTAKKTTVEKKAPEKKAPEKKPTEKKTAKKEASGSAADAVIAYLAAHPGATRKAILDGGIASFGLSEQEMKNRNPNSKFVRVGSLVGSALTALIEQGAIEKRGGEHHLTAESRALAKEARCEEELRALLKKKKYRKKDLLGLLTKRLASEVSASGDGSWLRPTVDRLLERMIADGEVVNGDGGMLCMVTVPRSDRILSEAECKKELLHQITARDGRFFERFLANALEKHFLISGRKVTYCNIPGGSEDGGIDVEIKTVDELGFSEYILVQAKSRESLHVTEKEVREFYGALHARNGSRGIYATTSTFHSSAQRFMDSLDNCVGIDGDRLFEILKKAEYGVKATKNGYTIDPTVF